MRTRASMVFLIISFFINVCGCVEQQYRVGDITYTNRKEAEDVAKKTLDEINMSIEPLPRPVAGRLIVVLPTKDYISKNCIRTFGPRNFLNKESVDYVATVMRMNVEAMPKYIEKFGLFETVDVVDTDKSPSKIPLEKLNKEYDWAFFLSDKGEHHIVERLADHKRWTIEPIVGTHGPPAIKHINERLLSIVAPDYNKIAAAIGGTIVVACDIRVILVNDGTVAAGATGELSYPEMNKLAQALARKIKEGVAIRGEPIAVVSLRDRSESVESKRIADELADKVSRELVETGWFDVKERINLRAVLDERDLETAGIVNNPQLRSKLGGVKYLVIGGVSVKSVPKE